MSKPSLMITHQVAVFLSHHVDYLGEINGGLMDTQVRNHVYVSNIQKMKRTRLKHVRILFISNTDIFNYIYMYKKYN
jgi:hypothetical protein